MHSKTWPNETEIENSSHGTHSHSDQCTTFAQITRIDGIKGKNCTYGKYSISIKKLSQEQFFFAQLVCYFFCFFFCLLCRQFIYEYVLSVTVRFIVMAFTYTSYNCHHYFYRHHIYSKQAARTPRTTKKEEKQALFMWHWNKNICCIQFGSNKSFSLFKTQICRLMIASYHKQPPKYITQTKDYQIKL